MLLLRLTGGLLVLFAVLRVGLIVRNWSTASASTVELAMSFMVGMRFDLAIAGYIAIPMMVSAFVPWTSPGCNRRARRVYVWVWSIFISLLAFLLLAEFEFFREFQCRYNQLAIDYLDHPQTVGGMIWSTYPVIRYALVWLIIAIIVRLAIGRAVNRSFPIDGQMSRQPWWVGVANGGVIIIAIVVAIRGGLQGEPLRWGEAFRGNSEFANQMSLNGLYSLLDAAKDTYIRSRAANPWRGGDLVEQRAVVRRMIVTPGERLLDPANRTALRKGDLGSTLVLRRQDGRPVNVVLVIMESFSGRYVGALGSPNSVTPSFDRLARDGVLFDRFLSAGSHTHQGVFTTQLAFPNLPSHERLMEMGISNQPFLGFSQVFAERGYDTFLLYNGDLAWDNMRGFFRLQGTKHFVSGQDMIADAKYLDAVWGVSDGDLFDRANREFETASKRGPFLATIITLSNHAPFHVPPVPGVEPITTFGEDNKRLEAMRYADYAIGRFISQARQLSYFNDTLFVFVGDHGFHVAPKLTEVHLLYHHVPLLFYSPGLIARGRVDHRVASNVDLLPSVMGLLGMDDVPRSPWGRSLFNDGFGDEGFAVFKMSTGTSAVALAKGDQVLVLGSATGKPQLSRYSLAFPPKLEPLTAPAVEAKLEAELRAYVGAALHDVTTQRAGSK